jgi:hypothetical protein
LLVTVLAKGLEKQKPGDPVEGGWVRGQKRSRVKYLFLIFFYGFSNSPRREMPKKSMKLRFGFFLDSFVKLFNKFFFLVVCSVFELLSLRNTQKRDNEKIEEN